MRTLTTPRLMVGILFVLLFALAVRVPADTDTWWHLRSGAMILSSHSVPFTDPFSLTFAGKPWIDQSWLAQIALFIAYQLAGNAGLALYTAGLAVVGLVFVFITCRGSIYLRAFVMIGVAATAAVFWSARPQMFSFVLAAAMLWLLYSYKRGGVDRLWAVPVLMALWVNLHSGFAIGFIFLGAAIVGEVLNGQPWPHIRRLLIITGFSVAALLINPYTYRMLLYPFQTAGIGALEQFIQEWASPDFHARETWPFLIMLFGMLAAAGFSRRGWDWTDLLLVVGTAGLSLVWQRNFSFFAIAIAPPLCDHLQTILDQIGVRQPAARMPGRGQNRLNWSILGLIALAAIFKIVLVLSPGVVVQAQSALLPVQAAAYLNQTAPPGPMFNTYNWGGYLMFAAPQYPVFVDGRTDLYGSDFLLQWRAALEGVGWQAMFSQWGIRLVVIERDSPLADSLRHDPTWKERYSDTLASVFER